MTRIRVDFDSVDRHGFTRGRLDRADGPMEVGDVVTAYDGEGFECEAGVTMVDPEAGTCRLVPHDTAEEIAEHAATVDALMPMQLRAIAALGEEET